MVVPGLGQNCNLSPSQTARREWQQATSDGYGQDAAVQVSISPQARAAVAEAAPVTTQVSDASEPFAAPTVEPLTPNQDPNPIDMTLCAAILLGNDDDANQAVMQNLLDRLGSVGFDQDDFLTAINTQRKLNQQKAIKHEAFVMVLGTQGRPHEALDKPHIRLGLENAKRLGLQFVQVAASRDYVQSQRLDSQAVLQSAQYVLCSGAIKFAVADAATMQTLGAVAEARWIQDQQGSDLMVSAYQAAFPAQDLSEYPSKGSEADKLAFLKDKLAQLTPDQKKIYHQKLGFILFSEAAAAVLADDLQVTDENDKKLNPLMHALKLAEHKPDVAQRLAHAAWDTAVGQLAMDPQWIRQPLTVASAFKRLEKELAANPGLYQGAYGDIETQLAAFKTAAESADLQKAMDAGGIAYTQFRNLVLAELSDGKLDSLALLDQLKLNGTDVGQTAPIKSS